MKARTVTYLTDSIPEDKDKLRAEIAAQVKAWEKERGKIKTTPIEPRGHKTAVFTITKRGRKPAQEVEE